MRNQLTLEEQKYFVDEVEKIREKLSCPIADTHDIEMYWNDKYNVDNGILGSFNWIRPNDVDVSPLGKDSPELLVSTIVHELHHRWQHKKYGPLYYLMLLPVVRQLVLEKTAKKVELEADNLLGLGGLGE